MPQCGDCGQKEDIKFIKGRWLCKACLQREHPEVNVKRFKYDAMRIKYGDLLVGSPTKAKIN